LVSLIEGRTQTDGASEYVVEEDTWALVGQGSRGLDFRNFMIKLYTSPNNIRVIKSRKMRWTGHVTRGFYGVGRGANRDLIGKDYFNGS
jgi:hypothetical protein